MAPGLARRASAGRRRPVMIPSPSPAGAPLESLSGLIERVSFFNEENGFAVLRVKVKGQRDLVAVVGSLPAVSAGEWLNAEGRWVREREFGLQFKAEHLTSSAPTSREGIEKYLGGGMVKGIGPVYAKKLVAKFGEGIFDIIENYSARLEEVPGIGTGRRRLIKAAWSEQKVIRGIMVFLHSQGVSTARAVRIYKTYGDHAIETVRADPYALARDIHGIGFKTADQIAAKLGIPRDSLARAAAGLSHVLLEATGAGHCALPAELLVTQAAKLLEVDETLVGTALERALNAREVTRETVGDVPWIFLPHLQAAEIGIAHRVRELASGPARYPAINPVEAAAWCAEKTGQTLAPSQQAALAKALTSRILIITGGPGVGKTTLLNAILLVLASRRVECLLCAPTGRAAKRMAEATGREARTIHRLLEGGSGEGGFRRHEHHPLDCDLLVVDECSMVDVPLMHHLLRALPPKAGLLLVGDVDQLPSVGPGLVLGHLIASGVPPVVRLTEVFRQAAHSRIITAAHQVNAGQFPDLPPRDTESDFYFVERAEPPDILRTLLEMVGKRIPARFQFDPVRDIQVLAPMNRGSLGVRELNLALQETLNPERPDQNSVEKFGWRFRSGDKVIQTANNYDKEVFNGDIGWITQVNLEERELHVQFDAREVRYDFNELDELSLAYAITIHKSQGSEFPVVVLPLANQHYLLLQRNLLYTALTRGRKLVVLVGQRPALATAIRNHRVTERYSALLHRLQTATD